MLIAALSFVTGPLQARALGPAGRGTLAAILVPMGFAPVLALLGLSTFASVAPARGKSASQIAGSIGALAAICGIAFALLGIPLAGLIAHGRDVVHTYLLVGFSCLPLLLPGAILQWILVGQQRWGWFAVVFLTGPIGVTTGIIVLYLSNQLTVESAAILALAGLLAPIFPAAAALRHGGPVRFDSSLAREGLGFGLRAWIGHVSSASNARLDQLLMTGLVPTRELGLYAVAVTLAAIPGLFAAAVGPPLLARVARGDRELIRRVLRVTLAVTVVIDIAFAVLTPLALPALFGEAFRPAVSLTWVLLAASVPWTGVLVLGPAFVSASRPGIPTICEIVALVTTVVGLIALLPSMGASGAALVTLFAYTVDFLFQVVIAKRAFGGHLRDYLAPRWSDVRWALTVVTR